MGEGLLSRRDRLIVARHEVPGLAMQRAPVPEGRSKSWSVPNGAKLSKLRDGFMPRRRGYRTQPRVSTFQPTSANLLDCGFYVRADAPLGSQWQKSRTRTSSRTIEELWGRRIDLLKTYQENVIAHRFSPLESVRGITPSRSFLNLALSGTGHQRHGRKKF
jgi:hypothetical protein